MVMEYVSYVTEVLRYHQFMFCIIKHNLRFNLRFNLILCFDLQIHDENVSLRVNSEFQDRYLGEPLDIEFTYNRLEKKSICNYINAFIFQMEIMCQICKTIILIAYIVRLTMRRCHNALDQSKQIVDSKSRFYSNT